VNPSPGWRQHVEALHRLAVKQHAAGAEVLLESLGGDQVGNGSLMRVIVKLLKGAVYVRI
jgi:hypothetical protein